MFVFLYVFLSVILAIIFFTLVERKLLALSQNRMGPYRFLQALQDGFKLFIKEITVLRIYSQAVFVVAPVMWFFFVSGCLAFFVQHLYGFFTFFGCVCDSIFYILCSSYIWCFFKF